MKEAVRSLELPGRVLLLAHDPARIESQLAGQDLAPAEAGPLRDDVSTDEITPTATCLYFDERLGRYPYTGLTVGGRRPIGIDAVRKGGFSVVVAGKRYGKGSSREHSPTAELAAGVRLVIAESFERIYRQNADNLGLFTSTDLGLVDRIRRREAITIEELLVGRDALAAGILRSGGLLQYGQQQRAQARDSHEQRAVPDDRLRTLVEKILLRHLAEGTVGPDALAPGTGVFVRADWRFIHEVYTGMCAHMLHSAFGRPLQLHEPRTILAFEDHLSYAHCSPALSGGETMAGVRLVSEAHRSFTQAYALKDHGYLSGGSGSQGISHPMMTERYALPGELVVGTDSHTPHSGALGCFAFGVGTTDMANAMMTGRTRLMVPETARVELNGALPPGITAKDVVLCLLAHPALRDGQALGKVIEFVGTTVQAMSVDERATLTNMTAEMGGLTGIVAPDAKTVRFLGERRGISFDIEPWMHSDPGARYALAVSIDCTSLTPMVAAPGDPGNGVPLGDLTERIRVDIAYGGSCTAGKRDDFDRYHEVLHWAAERGLRVKPGVTLYLQFGTSDVRDYCVERGYLSTFRQVGAELLEPACGACANFGPGASHRADQVTVSAINRNFPGRSGPGAVWLASPPTVAASAVAGELVSFAQLIKKTNEETQWSHSVDDSS
jgi:3-isopropylmalate/(R)-2-methylmalate dehydratase large subunit